MAASANQTDASQASADEQELRKRNQAIASALSWTEILWIAKKKPIAGSVVALHERKSVDATRLPCFLIPSLPQLSTDYLALSDMVDPRQPLFTVYMPTEKRTPENGTSVTALADFYAEAIDKSWPEGPLALAGWSAGGPISRAVAGSLQRLGREVRLLVIIDGEVPALKPRWLGVFGTIRLTWYRLASLTVKLIAFGQALVRHIRHRPEQNRALSPAIKAAWQNSALRYAWEGMVYGVKGMLGMMVPPESRLRPREIAGTITSLPSAHREFSMVLYDAACAYLPEKYDGAVLVYEATEEPTRTIERVAEKWKTIAANTQVISIKGYHMSIINPPDGLALARDLSRRLRSPGSI